ncbi:MAG: VIT1/CCC1 transporter family protein [Methyloceanibacter sp.]
MSRLRLHPENHLVDRIGWLRAAVLGANDGIVSTASLIVGVAAAAATQNDVLIAGIAGLVAGAMSMAAGEYVSVSSQSDTEQADLARERKEWSENVESELDELAEIYVKRGVDRALARQVAQQLMAKDALAAHARDELGISEITTARPVQAALTSAAAFSVGAAMPLLMVVVSPAGALYLPLEGEWPYLWLDATYLKVPLWRILAEPHQWRRERADAVVFGRAAALQDDCFGSEADGGADLAASCQSTAGGSLRDMETT